MCCVLYPACSVSPHPSLGLELLLQLVQLVSTLSGSELHRLLQLAGELGAQLLQLLLVVVTHREQLVLSLLGQVTAAIREQLHIPDYTDHSLRITVYVYAQSYE